MKTTSRGRCDKCGRVFTLTSAGVIRNHYGPSGWHERCEGSGHRAQEGSETTKTVEAVSRAWWWGVSTDRFIDPLYRSEAEAYRRAKQIQAITPRSETVRIYTFEHGSWTLHDALAGAQ